MTEQREPDTEPEIPDVPNDPVPEDDPHVADASPDKED